MPFVTGGQTLVTTELIVNGTIVDADVSNSAAINPNKINNGGWQKLDSVTLGADATTLSTNTFIAKKHLKFLIYIKGSAGGADMGIRFNGDTGANYDWNVAKEQGAVVQNDADTKVKFSSGAITAERTVILEVFNTLANEKRMSIRQQNEDDWWLGGGEWDNTAAQITSATLMLDDVGNITAGTVIDVYGSD